MFRFVVPREPHVLPRHELAGELLDLLEVPLDVHFGRHRSREPLHQG